LRRLKVNHANNSSETYRADDEAENTERCVIILFFFHIFRDKNREVLVLPA